MTKSLKPIFVTILGITTGLLAQESPSPSPIETGSPSPSPTEIGSPLPAPTPTTSMAPRSVPLRFVPPPMEGTISLGIWDSNDKLVRVLHREAKIDKFTVEENSLSTTWDGKNDAGEDLPAGKYRARGYLVGNLKVDDLGKGTSVPADATDHISVKLVMNPLVADTRAIIDITAGFDDKGTYLETMDHLPLATIRSFSNVWRIKMAKNGEKTADAWLDEEQDEMPNSEHVRVSNIDKMMAFDCGFFELR